MLAAVEFDEDFSGQAGEIYDIGADGLLAAEFVAVQLFVAQVVPESALRRRFGFVGGLGLFGEFEGSRGV